MACRVFSSIIESALTDIHPLLSFVILANGPWSLTLDAVRSVLRQTVPPLEIVVIGVEAGLIDELKQIDQTITIAPPHAQALDVTNSDLITVGDSYDLFMPDFSERMVIALMNNEDVAIAYSGAWTYRDDHKSFRRNARNGLTQSQVSVSKLLRQLERRSLPFAPIVVHRSRLGDHSAIKALRLPGKPAIRRVQGTSGFANGIGRLVLPPSDPIVAFPHLAESPRPASTVDRLLRREIGEPDIFGSERSFSPEIGRLRWQRPIPGYYIDFRIKSQSPVWPVHWLPPRERELYVSLVQWGLGAFEHYLSGAGEEFRSGAIACAEHLLDRQCNEGPQAGAWLHLFPMPHTYPLRAPWHSAITQGEAASFFARLFLETGEERYADAARLSLKPMTKPTSEGGALADLNGGPFVEEYPTTPPSFVLNGAIFGIWGFYDVGQLLGDEDALEWFDRLAATLADNVASYDTGRWSQYDLYPHRSPNVASPAYHLLHIRQLKVLAEMFPSPQLEATIQRFENYRGSGPKRWRAVADKIAFRIRSPRNRSLVGH